MAVLSDYQSLRTEESGASIAIWTFIPDRGCMESGGKFLESWLIFLPMTMEKCGVLIVKIKFICGKMFRKIGDMFRKESLRNAMSLMCSGLITDFCIFACKMPAF
jgi:hypothetical protein